MMEKTKKETDSADPVVLLDPGSYYYRPSDLPGAYKKLYDIIEIVFWILLVSAIGFLAFNQGMGFFYKAHLLKAPCDLCGDLNPEVQSCINNLNTRISYPDGSGNWTDPFAEKKFYNITIPKK